MSATAPPPDADESVQYVPLDLIDPAPSNRDIGPEETLEELARSIKAKGILQAIVVSPKEGGRFEIVFGHRRFEGAKRAGLETIKSEVRDYNEQERRELRLIENVLRKDPTPVEEALAYQELLQLNPKLNQAKLAARLGIAQGTISRRLKLLGLPKKLQEDVNSNRIPAEDAYHLAKLAKFPERIERARAEAKKLGNVQLAVNKELEDLKNALKRETATDDLKTRGIPVAPDGWQRTGMRLGDEDGMLSIDPFEHQTEPCHAAIISDAGAITYICTEPKRHGWDSGDVPDATEASESSEGAGEPSDEENGQEPPSATAEPASKDKPQTSKPQSEAAARAAAERKAEAEAERARVEALRDAEQARRAALRTALKGRLTKDMERHIYWQVLNATQVDHDTIAKELLDLPAAEGDESPLRTFASKSDERLKKAAFAVLAMLAEGPLHGSNPNFQHETVPAHYQILARLGHMPTPIEQAGIASDEPASADVA